MPDFEKVIKGLECCITGNCEDCGYEKDGCLDNTKTFMNDLKRDALALLKEREQSQRDYEAAVEMEQYCEHYEPTYNPEDGSL